LLFISLLVAIRPPTIVATDPAAVVPAAALLRDLAWVGLVAGGVAVGHV
jgi:hypothetical protein